MATRKKKYAAAKPAKVSKAAALREKDVAGLQTEIKDLQKAHFGLRMQKATQQLQNTSQLKKVRKDIAAVKVVMPTVLHDIAWRAMQVHGALGVTNEVPFLGMVTGAAVMGLADGPTEVHKTTVAKQVLRDYRPAEGTWPSEWIPAKREAARAKYAQFLEHEVGNL